MRPIEAAAASPQRARRAIDGALCRDRGRLLGLWAKWNAKPGDAALREAFAAKLQVSIAERERRAAALPTASIEETLPIAAHADELVELIRKHQVVVVAGETGSGKTTQLPKLCLLAGRGAAGMVGCTQPRRIAARSVARRVAEELQVPFGGAVGYQVRFNDAVSEQTAIKFMTDGILLAEIQNDRWLSKYDTIIVDEAHERSLNIDFLLGYLRQLLPKRPDLKLIVTSATIDTERFAAHFGDAPVVNVEGRGYPVEVRYRPLEGEGEDAGERTILDGIVAACDEIQRDRGIGDTLIFLPGEREIRDAHQALERRKYRHIEVLPLYARLSARDQDRVFHPGPQRRIVLATNVAETSLTVPRIHYVVDPGVARVKRYSPRQKLDRLHIEEVSQASANQRAGRCGRIAPGTCIRLYSEADFLARPEFTDPEIRRAALAGVILRMLSLGLGEIEKFPFLEPPDPRAVADGWQQLNELGAVDAQRKLIAIGRTMAKLPVDVKLARMLVAANAHGVLREMLVVASFLGIADPRERPADARAAADAAHAQFADAKSEFVGILKLWNAYRDAHEELTQSQLRKWADRNFLGFLRLREWRELHRQLKLQCEELGWSGDALVVGASAPTREKRSAPGPKRGTNREYAIGAEAPPTGEGKDYVSLHRALIAGLPTQIGHRGDKGVYDGPRGRKFQLFPGSKLASKPPPWVLSATLLDTEKVWAITNAGIEPDWAIAELPHLLARRHHDPHWSRSQGRVLGSEQISLFGLVLAPKKPVHYGALFPEESRGIFVREALLTGAINTRSVFLQRNLHALELAKEEEAKLRRIGLVVDEDWQARWYLDRLPAHVHNAQALDAWYGKLSKDEKAALEWSRDDLLVADQSDAARFPAFIALGDVRLAVRYRFEPGAVDDGMTVVVPLHLLNALDAARLSWLAPGFVEDKAIALIKSLPKALRRNFVPAPDFARAFAEAHSSPEADSIEGALGRFLKKLSGVEVGTVDFDPAGIEPHLRANLRLQDADGKSVLAESRDLDELRGRFGKRAAEAFAKHAAQGMARAGITVFPDAPIPQSVPGAGGVPAYPALQDDGDSASLVVHAQREVAERLHPRGVRRLLAIALAEKMKQARKQLPVQPKISLLYAAIESANPRVDGLKDADRLRSDLVDGAFAALADAGLLEVRDVDAFAQRRDAISKHLFAEAMRRLQQAETILGLVAEIRAKLEAKLVGWASGNLDDMRSQLEALAHPGFLRDVPVEALAEYPRWLKALSLRAERAQRDPARDQQRMLELAPFVDALANADPADAETQALRWELEELRVQLFAQELGAKGGVSPKKLAQRVQRLRRIA
ncbi:ATP-dependent RNA helicase HrpA [Pseudoluteimonas lycopersici]|uniref:ATP-dependent RNA helicase HrpA n=1 Tax=Pseudoluteimonas lycopersici TaxID=1324796 RepID=A0A516V7Q9_9GAMM|nr:ATP-dependent RNA helicase HrpA [Lysobacter lycopersici]QDQ74569.1 ATP-dependent RNA helicase HrpA [Lysobacter lycopersici]